MTTPSNQRSIIVKVVLTIVICVIASWFLARSWLVADLTRPSFGQNGCYSIRLESPDLGFQSQMLEAIQTDSRLILLHKGNVESNYYSSSLLRIGYVKISAPANVILDIQSIVESILRERFPQTRPLSSAVYQSK